MSKPRYIRPNRRVTRGEMHATPAKPSRFLLVGAAIFCVLSVFAAGYHVGRRNASITIQVAPQDCIPYAPPAAPGAF
jgi:hypothetical protein